MKFFLNKDVKGIKPDHLLEKLEMYGTSIKIILIYYTLLLLILFNFYLDSYIAIGTQKLVFLYLLSFGMVTFFEYVIHRFLFHHSNPDFIFRKIHLRHHKDPNYSAHATVPIMASTLLIFLLTTLGSFSMFTFKYWMPLCFFMIINYLIHESTHYLNHQHSARSPWGRYFKVYHNHHHAINNKYNYGFMVPFWDMIFGTYKIKQEEL